LQKHKHQMLKMKTSDGVTLQQNEKSLSNIIKSSETAGHDTNHVPNAPLPPEELTSNSAPIEEDEKPNLSLA